MKEFIYYDFDVFDDFDCDTAFLLGMIFTDGSLYEYSNTGKQFIRIINKNKYLIENCRDILKSNLEIHYVKEREYNGIKQGGFYYLHISNEDIIDELIEFGVCNDSIHQINETTTLSDIINLEAVYYTLLSNIFIG